MRLLSSPQQPPTTPISSGAELLDSLHALPSGFAPRQAKRCEQAFRRAIHIDPTDAPAQAGLLQILRERAVHSAAYWPHQKRRKQGLERKALAQLGVVLQSSGATQLADVLNHADDLWTACTTPQSEALLRDDIVGALGRVLGDPVSCDADVRAALRALDRLSVLQPWTLPSIVLQLEAYAERAQLTPAHIALVPPIMQRALAAPWGLGPRAVQMAQRLCQSYPTDLSVLLAGCLMLKGVLLGTTPPLILGQHAITQMLVLATAVPGEQASYEGARVLLQAAQQYDKDVGAHGATLAVMALDAVQQIIDAGGRREGDALVRSMAERTWLQLEQTGQTQVAKAATVHLASRSPSLRRVTAPRVS